MPAAGGRRRTRLPPARAVRTLAVVSVPVELADLAATIREQGPTAYLLSTADDGRPHAVAVTPVLAGPTVEVEAGRRTRANVATRPLVSLLWPPSDPQGYSLIVDGVAALGDPSGEGPTVRVTPSSAVLHRPAPAAPTSAASGCGSDCEPVPLT